MSGRKKPERQRSRFGAFLASKREQADLTTAQAARRLRLKSRQVLDNYEIGRTFPSVPVLIRLAQLYGVSREEVLEEAYWPQLILLPLMAIIEPDQLAPDLLEELGRGLYEAEREELTQYIDSLLRRRPALARR